jgi:hypothetical protein
VDVAVVVVVVVDGAGSLGLEHAEQRRSRAA